MHSPCAGTLASREGCCDPQREEKLCSHREEETDTFHRVNSLVLLGFALTTQSFHRAPTS